jgi:hypothetical protein
VAAGVFRVFITFGHRFFKKELPGMTTRQVTVATSRRKWQWIFRLCAIVIALPLVCWGLIGQPVRAATHDPTSPTFSITSPVFSGGVVEGPMGANVVVKAPPGSMWTPNATITLSAVEDGPGVACNSATTTPIGSTTPATITVGADGSFSAAFAWPTSLPEINNTSTTYDLCGSESNGGAQMGMASNKYILLTNAPPQITVSPTTAQVKQTVTVTGTSWLPISQLFFSLNGATANPSQAEQLQTSPQQVFPDTNGNFNATVTLPSDLIGGPATNNGLVIIVGMGTQVGTTYPVQVTSPQLTINPAPHATATPTPTATATTTPASTSTAPAGTTTSKTDKLLIGLLGLIAVVLLLAGIIVAVLALRGRTGRESPPPAQERKPSGGFSPYGGNNFGQSTFDETVAGGPDWRYQQQQPSPLWRDDDDDRWQPPGRPWSGARASSPYDDRGALPPPAARRYEDDDDDRYRTRMGDPYQPPTPPRSAGPPPVSRPMGGPPPSRPMGGPPPSRPMPPRSYPRPDPPPWGDDTAAQDTGPGWPPPMPPQR